MRSRQSVRAAGAGPHKVFRLSSLLAFCHPFMAEPDFATQLRTHRPYLVRIAFLQLRDSDLAEDIVQDTLLAALQGAAGFSGRSSLKTWLPGILKHKIVDAIRKKGRGPAMSSLEEECQIDDFDALFDESGHWENPPATWGDPEGELSRRQFFDVVDFCLARLPPNTAGGVMRG